MALDTYKKEKDKIEKEEAIKKGTYEDPDSVLTLKKILGNTEQSDLFGKLVEADGATGVELMSRLVKNELKDGDVESLAEYRDKFSEKMDAAEKINAQLTPEIVKEMAKLSPDFNNVADILGNDEVLKMVQKNIKELAVNDEVKFDDISKQVKVIKDFEDGDLKTLNEKIETLCKENGYNSDEYLKILAISDIDKRNDALNTLVKARWDKEFFGEVKKIGNWLIDDYYSKNVAVEIAKQKDVIDKAYETLGEAREKLGSILAMTIDSNEVMQDALSREIIGGQKKEVVSMKEMRDEIPDEEDIVREWTEERKKIKNWGTMAPADQAAKKDDFFGRYKNKTEAGFKKKGGFWSRVFGGMSNVFFGSFDPQTALN